MIQTSKHIGNANKYPVFRRSHLRGSIKKSVLKNIANLSGKRLCMSLIFDKVRPASLSSAILLKTDSNADFFLVNFGKFLRITFLQNTYGRLLLGF